ncbi:MipA/OmpV family protein [Sphingomonas yunnanensis]|uniref:MipA/OmpV family protein n=1 Tax=Sphingomonas yunnanensis TaxID=310400 RepID=UPI001CA6194F|nr:MipA/OmpV family protein [Sphingomonas yunnanensis]MBY9062612.1 MipA/OmpV family protein [Sphingomonas yunnanensis]
MSYRILTGTALAATLLTAAAAPAIAQQPAGPPDGAAPQDLGPDVLADQPLLPTEPGQEKRREPLRVRVGAGPQLVPGFPGNDALRLTPMISVARARGDTPFGYGAPDDGTTIALIRRGRTEFGPTVELQGRRRTDDIVPGLPAVGRTVELGGYAQTWTDDRWRWHGEVRKGLGGHEGWISQLGVDYVRRDRDAWLVSFGPRAVVTDSRYQRAWFGVSPEAAARTGLAAYSPGGGLQSLGATSRVIYALTPRWGVQAQAVYQRLIGDAARSPVIRRVNSHDQLSAGLALTYTFSIRR